MGADMLVIVITPEDIRAGAASEVTEMLRLGGNVRVHLRYPHASDAEVSAVLDAIPRSLWHRVSVHGHDAVVAGHPGVGMHLAGDAACPGIPLPPGAALSKSCHSVREAMEAAPTADYVTLSPVFDSISKQGYRAAIDTGAWNVRQVLRRRTVVALGGMTPGRLAVVAEAGFAGAAFLGYVWNDADPVGRCRDIVAAASVLRRKLPGRTPQLPMQFVTDGQDAAATIKQARLAVEGGCRWIQVRMKDAGASGRDAALSDLRDFCRNRGAVLIVDDDVDAVLRNDIDGVHLGRNDMPPGEARAILGPYPLIGATVNHIEDIERLVDAPIDYVGLGPWRFTTTKRVGLAEPLGADGTRRLVRAIRHSGIQVPVLAIGGITAEDIPAVLASGADGIAVSGAIARASDPAGAARAIVSRMQSAKEG